METIKNEHEKMDRIFNEGQEKRASRASGIDAQLLLAVPFLEDTGRHLDPLIKWERKVERLAGHFIIGAGLLGRVMVIECTRPSKEMNSLDIGKWAKTSFGCKYCGWREGSCLR